MKAIYQNALNNSISYDEYRKLIDVLISENKTSGNEQNEMLIDFTKLNQQRMKRLDKTQQLSNELIEHMQDLKEKQVGVEMLHKIFLY